MVTEPMRRVGNMTILPYCDFFATPTRDADLLAGRIAKAIDPATAVAGQDFSEFFVRHALRVRIHELERDAAILKSRLRASQV
jgi:hypothetical protein